ncbi:hypothetical protein NF701_07345 [Sphingomonadaceae bacterium OTU29THOMA1]|nr:hypothetical protein NF701_07345 [Sphingomonadaceae bacterium OTU29THOMA1]
MPGLSNIFGSDNSDSSSTESNSLDNVLDINSTLGLDADSSQSSYDQDEDGNISAQQSDDSFGLDTSTDGLLSSVSDTFNSNDESTS